MVKKIQNNGVAIAAHAQIHRAFILPVAAEMCEIKTTTTKNIYIIMQ